ncbi:MAG: 3',5'-cyclic-AMP phosphodiesterase [Gammaproteobacteria bacterium]
MNPHTSVFRILHITDTHLHAQADARMRGVNTYDTFKTVIAAATSDGAPPHAILATGDLVQDETRAGYERFREALEPCGVPVYCIPGNHDAPKLMTEVLSKDPFQFCGTVARDNWQLILLDTRVRGDDGGALDKGQLQDLERELSEAAADNVLICMHHHPVPMGSRWLDGVALHNPDEFMEIVDEFDHVRGILWGHVHQASDRRRKGMRLMSTPSTCSQFRPNSDDFAIDKRGPGYRWLNLRSNGTIETEVVWLDWS